MSKSKLHVDQISSQCAASIQLGVCSQTAARRHGSESHGQSYQISMQFRLQYMSKKDLRESNIQRPCCDQRKAEIQRLNGFLSTKPKTNLQVEQG